VCKTLGIEEAPRNVSTVVDADRIGRNSAGDIENGVGLRQDARSETSKENHFTN
jgi:hypothetical protein